MKKPLEDVLRDACQRAIKGGELVTTTLPPLFLSVPKAAEYGDLACDVALMLARGEGRHPHAVADTIVRHIDDREHILADVSVAGPGFINIRFAPAYWWSCLATIAASGERYGRSPVGADDRAHVASPDPASILDVRHARAIVVADVLARLRVAAGQPVAPDSAVDEVAPVRLRQRALSGRIEERAGELVTWRELIETIGIDAARFFLAATRPNDVLTVDLDVARRRAAENPFFYVRYVDERIARVVRRAAEMGLDGASHHAADVRRLGTEAELGLIRSLVDLERVAVRREPHGLVAYLTALAADFHRYYNRNRILGEESELARARLVLVANVQKVMHVGLELLGISVPATM